MRLLIITCLTCLLVGVASFAAILQTGLQTARAQDCEPGSQVTSSSTPAALPSKGSIVINEIMLVPLKAPLYCALATGSSTDTVDKPRIELYNASSQAVQLPHGGIDSGPNTTIYNFALDSMAAHSFIVIFLPIDHTTEISHNALIRLTSSGSVLDQVNLPTIPAEMSYARTSDGGSSWHITQSSTLGISNVPPPPVTATASSNKKPTPTPKARHATPTAKASSRTQGRSSNSGASQSKKSTPVATHTSQQNKYIQANWKDVHVPTPASHPDTMDIVPTSGSDSTQQSGNENILPKVILSGLLLLLTVVIWQCRRLFRKP